MLYIFHLRNGGRKRGFMDITKGSFTNTTASCTTEFETPKLNHLTDSNLLSRFGKLVRTERKITHLILACIAEIDIRRLFLEKAYPSLFEFLVREYGYSPSAALRRIDGARLLREVPDLSRKIEKGSLNLSQLSQLQQAVRTVQKTENIKIPTLKKMELMVKIENSTQKETELILAQELSLPSPPENKERTHKDESVTLTITLTKEQMASLKKARDLCAHSLKQNSWSEFFTFLSNKEIKIRTQTTRCIDRTTLYTCDQTVNFKKPLNVCGTSRPAVNHEKSVGTTNQNEQIAQPPFALSGKRRAIGLKVKRSFFSSQKCCQFKDPTTGRICANTKFLQMDHIRPVWAGGTNAPENLQLLCAQHNRFKYKKEAGLHPLRR